MSTNIVEDVIAKTDWGAPFVRELDLVIAANALASMQSGQTLYNSDINKRVAAHVSALDKGLEPKFLGVVSVPPNDDAPYKRVPDATDFLKALPRGHWAIFQMDGRYDAYMSDGCGGVSTESGSKFIYTSSKAGALTFDSGYASVLGYSVYLRRNRIEAEILAHSAREAQLDPGSTVQGEIRINGKTWRKAIFEAVKPDYYVGGTPAYQVRFSRPGKAVSLLVEPSAFLRIFSLPLVMPPQYNDPGNEARLTSLLEDRDRAAQSAWSEWVSQNGRDGIDPFGTSAPFVADGDTLVRSVFRESDGRNDPSGKFYVTFKPGTSEPVDASLEWEISPVLGR